MKTAHLKRLEKKLSYLCITDDLSKIMWTIKGFIDNDVHIIYPSAEGALLTLTSNIPLIIVSDSHGLRKAFHEFLFEKKYIENSTNFDLLMQGKIEILMLGDALHSENRSLWANTLIDEYMSQYVHHSFYGDMPAAEKEMADSLGLIAAIMTLLVNSPQFYYLKGNHDNIRNTTEDGNCKVVKYLDNADHGEGAILKAALESWIVRRTLKKEGLRSWESFFNEMMALDDKFRLGSYSIDKYYQIYDKWLEDLNYLKGKGGWLFYNEFLAKYSRWENLLPILALYNGSVYNLLISHAPPGNLYIKDINMIKRRTPEVVFNFTWPNDPAARRGDHVSKVCDLILDKRDARQLYITGHITTEEGVEIYDNNSLFIINKPGSLMVLIVWPDRELFGIDMISTTEE